MKRRKVKRIQRKRLKGWQMPQNTVYVGRPTNWGNPFEVINDDYQEAIETFEDWLYQTQDGRALLLQVHELRGKDLCCWCPPDKPCHADLLLELAEADTCLIEIGFV